MVQSPQYAEFSGPEIQKVKEAVKTRLLCEVQNLVWLSGGQGCVIDIGSSPGGRPIVPVAMAIGTENWRSRFPSGIEQH